MFLFDSSIRLFIALKDCLASMRKSYIKYLLRSVYMLRFMISLRLKNPLVTSRDSLIRKGASLILRLRNQSKIHKIFLVVDNTEDPNNLQWTPPIPDSLEIVLAVLPSRQKGSSRHLPQPPFLQRYLPMQKFQFRDSARYLNLAIADVSPKHVYLAGRGKQNAAGTSRSANSVGGSKYIVNIRTG